MCGIAGLFLEDESLRPQLGTLLSDMLMTMTDRGPDSAGIAIYSGDDHQTDKTTVQSDRPDEDFATLEKALADSAARLTRNDTHAVVTAPAGMLDDIETRMKERLPGLWVMNRSEAMEIYKEVGLPADVVDRFGIRAMQGSHGIGHTRMATESAVTTMGAHPF